MKPNRVGRCLLFLLCSIFLFSCKTSDDANAAAKQLATTSADLVNYYGTLSKIAAADIALSELQKNLLHVPFEKEDRTQMSTLSSELQKRANVAQALQGLSTAFSNLTGSTAPTDVSNAASKLGTELQTLNALPQLKGAPIPLPTLIGDAAGAIVTLIRNHEERKAAPAMDKTVSALKELFTKEEKAYDSLNNSYDDVAKALAQYCIDKNLLDETSVLGPALQPFGLKAHISSTTDTTLLKKAATTQLQETLNSLNDAHHSASVAMLQGITDMGTRIHQLATEGHMPSRGTPITLTTVENWITTASTYLSGSPTSTGSAAASTSSQPTKK
jgi:hypothetical protein